MFGTRTAVLALVAAAIALPGCANDSNIERRRRAPTVEIVTPDDLAVFRQGAGAITLEGIVADSAQPAESLTVYWDVGEGDDLLTIDTVADTEGFAAIAIDPDTLPLGEHLATLHAIDNDDQHGSASVRFVVAGPVGSPVVTITSPNDGDAFDVGASITFVGEATDTTTAPGDLEFAWISEGLELPGAVSADGQSIVITSTLPAGLNTIELRVTDADGDVGIDTVAVRIQDDVVSAEPGDVVFSEMNVNPEVVDDELGEWVELFNTSGSSIDISGYTFRDDDNDAWTLQQGDLVVGPGEYIVLCADMSPQNNGGVPCDGHFNRDWQGGGIALGNGEDELVLTRPDGVEIDWLHYDNNWYTPGVAIGVHPDHLDGGDNDHAAHWCLQTTVIATGGEPGTPGRANDPC